MLACSLKALVCELILSIFKCAAMIKSEFAISCNATIYPLHELSASPSESDSGEEKKEHYADGVGCCGGSGGAAVQKIKCMP